MNLNDNFKREIGIPSRPSALPKGISFTRLRSSSVVSSSSSKVLSQDSTKSRKLTRGGLYLFETLNWGLAQ